MVGIGIYEDDLTGLVADTLARVDDHIAQNNYVIPVSDTIRFRIEDARGRYHASDNIAEFIRPGEKEDLIAELAGKFQGVLESLVIDTDGDPNSKGTAKRLAKMYINEIMAGRYEPAPDATAFPNDDPSTRYTGLLTVQAELKSVCSHHHQPVTGVAYIGVIPGTKVIGLSKYARIAQWLARRGTLQEELTRQIADYISHATGSEDVAVVVRAHHGCCENRGIMAKDSTSTTAVLRGQFYGGALKAEFYDHLKLNGGFSCS